MLIISFSESSPLGEALKLSGLRKEFGSRSFLFCPENAFLWRYENLSQPTARLRQQLEKVQNSGKTHGKDGEIAHGVTFSIFNFGGTHGEREKQHI